MITANIQEAKDRLVELVTAVEESNEVVILCRNGKPVAEIRQPAQSSAEFRSRLVPNPALAVTFAPGYDPTEPASEDEWPEECR